MLSRITWAKISLMQNSSARWRSQTLRSFLDPTLRPSIGHLLNFDVEKLEQQKITCNIIETPYAVALIAQ